MSALPTPPEIIVARLLASVRTRPTSRRRKAILQANASFGIMARAQHRLPKDGGGAQ